MNLSKLVETQGLTLTKGAHADGQGTCFMEAVAWLAGERHSAAPRCTSPLIRSIMIKWNDRLRTDADRMKWLGPLIVHVVGTNHAELEQRRAYICADYAVRKLAPMALLGAGRVSDAETLERLPPIVDKKTALAGKSAAAAAAVAAAVDDDDVDDVDVDGYAAAAAGYAVAGYAAAADADAVAGYAAAATYAATDGGDELNKIMTQMVMDLCMCSDGLNSERDMLISASLVRHEKRVRLCEYSVTGDQARTVEPALELAMVRTIR